MKRAYELNTVNVQNMVSEGKAGTYYLGEILENKFYVLYVGRSDGCLRTRLLQHAKTGEFNYFRFRVSRTKKNAYKRECYAFHLHKNTKNKVHPAHNGSCSCPICSCVDEFQTALPEYN